MKSDTRIYIGFVLVGGFALMAFRYWIAPATADAAVVILAGLMLNQIVSLIRQDTSDAKVEPLIAKVDTTLAVATAGVAQSVENGQQLAASTQQTSTGLEALHQQGNGHQTEQLDEIRALRLEVADLKQERAVTAATKDSADASELRIIAAAQTAVSDAAALAPPVESTPAGTTIAGPVTITPLGDTTIVMPEPSS